jgi:predicted enzyme related to lactoylglutathione lyase
MEEGKARSAGGHRDKKRFELLLRLTVKNTKTMRKATLLILIITASFCTGFALRTIVSFQNKKTTAMKKATGIGGIFFKCKDPNNMKEWYQKHLGLNTTSYGAIFEWYEGSDNTKKGLTTWAPFADTTKYFDPSTKDFMINYRVENLVDLVEQLKKDGVTIVDKIETFEYGKFVHIIDPEGNKVELWEPM